jgi:hypothetical protein
MASVHYFPRKLHLQLGDGEDRLRTVDEDELLAVRGPKVILGEPGMGKSQLIEELGRRLGVKVISARRFMASDNPSRFVTPEKPLMIDGLDEAVAVRDGHAVDLVFGKLEDAGSPDFIICCRSREWQSRSEVALKKIYGAEPSILVLDPFSRWEADQFLRQRYPQLDVDHVLEHLADQGITELYQNPLTLDLMGQVASADAALPSTRAGLFERVCTLLWPEHDSDRAHEALGQLSVAQALSAAGAVSAGLILAGADAISLANPGQVMEGDIRLAELTDLPDAGAARAIFSSKLFLTIGPGRAKPVHRVLAEYLGARWLADRARTTRVQKRLLAQFQLGDSVPASQRGLHAWLAFHSATMAGAIIDADPYGVLRYGETSQFTAEQAHRLLDALDLLSSRDPLFRSRDGGSNRAAGLMHEQLKSRVERIIGAEDGNAHLRSLLIEGLVDTPLARELQPVLEQVIFSPRYYYRDRENAARALMACRDRVWWRKTIELLQASCTQAAFTLAQFVIEEIDCDVPDVILVGNILACSGLLVCPATQADQQLSIALDRPKIISTLDATRLLGVLNLLTEHIAGVEVGEGVNPGPVVDFIALLIARAIAEKIVQPHDTALVWSWLSTRGLREQYGTEEQRALSDVLDEHQALRRAVQQHVLFDVEARRSVWEQHCDLDECLLGLREREDDLVWFLEQHATQDIDDPKARDAWRDLMLAPVRRPAFSDKVRAASRLYQRNDSELEAFIHNLEHPPKPDYQIRREEKDARLAAEFQAQYEREREDYLQNHSSLLRGELREILPAARFYLGHRYVYGKSVAGETALTQWLGADLAKDALHGFEAVFHRDNLPSLADVAQSVAQSSIWNYCYPILAGLLVRLRAGRDFTAIPEPVIQVGLAVCLHNQLNLTVDDLGSLRRQLELRLFGAGDESSESAGDPSRGAFVSACLEPSVAAGNAHISAMHILFSELPWRASAIELAAKWLSEHTSMAETVEAALLYHLIDSDHADELVAISRTRALGEFGSETRMLRWKAVDFLIRFQEVEHALVGVSASHPQLLGAIMNCLPTKRPGLTPELDTVRAKWIIQHFRCTWPRHTMPRSSDGSQAPYEASAFILSMIGLLAHDTRAPAIEALRELIAQPADSYTLDLLHMAAEQRQKRVEEEFDPLQPEALMALLADGPPSNIGDLRALVLHELSVIQQRLSGDDLELVSLFWNDSGLPYVENTCRDRLGVVLSAEMRHYGIQMLTEVDMPKSKRADFAFICDELQLPMEVKGQWHDEVWEGAQTQLEERYLIDWRSQGCGIYCVLWFGSLASRSGRRLQAPPMNIPTPATAEHMRAALIESLPEAVKPRIDVVVIDFEAGQPVPAPRVRKPVS